MPKGGTSRYPKVEKLEEWQELRIRILDKPLIWWLYFNKDNKPVRTKEQPKDVSEAQVSKFSWKPQVDEFWAFKVYNYETEQIEIFEVKKNATGKV